eukprot:CAMPEP_0113515244 /NCGR_PEP_ID=MMETSP0014_2-20120614/40837_1 /TAXON_ID=2857 /ORGANISM="Nitzschia sp." /LENGTH=327 /DNA_ID=CAMNT_0000411791 /DNA_START=386 /DNA_END=1366 /DNA_ORIENTATION=+ /assembly_acc=CAM_ASM_000159
MIRGERYYNASNNSSLPSPTVIARRLNIQPTKETSAQEWQRAWKNHKRLLPFLHSTDRCKPPDSSLNLACMWWKALSGNDKSSPVYDEGLAYDLLPSVWRKLVSSKVQRLYPRLHHGNVELRTAYLDKCVRDIVQEVQRGDNKNTTKFRLVCMGAGYDTRGIKMLERGLVDRVVELDLPGVVEAKKRLFQRLLKRRPKLRGMELPTLIASDLNEVANLKIQLQNLLRDDDDDSTQETVDWFAIFVFEGVMIYLDEGIPSALLNVTSSVLRDAQRNGALCLADRLENVPGGDPDAGDIELEGNGWDIVDWSPKPGLARHMLSARLLLQ